MHNELLINIGKQKHKAFLQNGFYSSTVVTTTMHKHNYAEVHVVDGDCVEFNVENSVHSSSDGNLIIIPRNCFHCVKKRLEGTSHAAFQVDFDVKAFSAIHIDNQTVVDFISEIKKCSETGDYLSVSAYISLFCSQLCHNELKAEPITDYSFLIYEFFSKHYHEDIHLNDLANVLHLSERQTERLVIKCTGNTFVKELAEVRMNVADHLLKTTDMSLEEISSYIGYRSYAGFWKAKKRLSTYR